MSADVHDIFDQAFDRLLLALLPRQALAQRIDDGLGHGLAGSLRECPCQAVGFRIFDAQSHVSKGVRYQGS